MAVCHNHIRRLCGMAASKEQTMMAVHKNAAAKTPRKQGKRKNGPVIQVLPEVAIAAQALRREGQEIEVVNERTVLIKNSKRP